jgi:hypothetical protein
LSDGLPQHQFTSFWHFFRTNAAHRVNIELKHISLLCAVQHPSSTQANPVPHRHFKCLKTAIADHSWHQPTGADSAHSVCVLMALPSATVNIKQQHHIQALS